MIDFDDCNSGAIHTPAPITISTTITTHHFYIITAKLQTMIKPQVILLNTLILSYKEFMANMNHIDINRCNVKVNNKLFYVNKEEYIKLCTNGDYNKYKINIYKNTDTHSRSLELMWIQK